MRFSEMIFAMTLQIGHSDYDIPRRKTAKKLIRKERIRGIGRE